MSKSIQLKNKDNEKMYPHPYYPVGSIYLSVNNTNPSKWFGGTWEQIAKGRTLVGVDINDTDFNTVKKTGGSKSVTLTTDQMPSHYHDFYDGAGNRVLYWDVASLTSMGGLTSGSTVKYSWSSKTKNVGGGKAHTNLQPYFTCYIWCRTA